jgi:hypothetical protein
LTGLRDRLEADDVGIISRRVMAAVEEGLATASSVETEIEFKHEVRKISLPRQTVKELRASINRVGVEFGGVSCSPFHSMGTNMSRD